MKILFDQGTPMQLCAYLAGHTVDTVIELGWTGFENDRLLDAAEKNGYQLLVTTDYNRNHPHNLRGRKLGVLVLLSTSWQRLQAHAESIAQMIEMMQAGEYGEFDPE